jgi:curved DNA-binding protein CbpA
MYTYFEGCTNQAEAKARYRELTRQHHPDAGGDTRTMQDINAEYSKFMSEGAKTEARDRQRTAHAQDRKSAADFHDLDEVGEKIRIMIEMALNLEGVEVELMGLWVWLTGNTKAHVQAFKDWNETHETKWRWMHKKQAWVYAGVPSFNRKEKSLDEIRNTYGSQKFSRERQAESIAGALHA